MSEKIDCRVCQESLPLLFADALSRAEVAAAEEHMSYCRKCQAMLEKERRLFETASDDSGKLALGEHPPGEALDYFVRSKNLLTGEERESIEMHLQECVLCSDIVTQLRKLPESLQELSASKDLKIISRLDATAEHVNGPRVIDLAKRILWQPLAGYAAAAAVLLLTFMLPHFESQESVGYLRVEIPSVTRGSEENTIIPTRFVHTIVNLKYSLSPEAGHSYNIEIRPETRKIPSQTFRQFTAFDSAGYANITVLLEVGNYQLLVTDIEDGDTIITSQEIEIQRTR